MIMCVAPRPHPRFSAEITAFIYSVMLGLTNGILGSVPMIQAPSKVDDRHRELTGKKTLPFIFYYSLLLGLRTRGSKIPVIISNNIIDSFE